MKEAPGQLSNDSVGDQRGQSRSATSDVVYAEGSHLHLYDVEREAVRTFISETPS